MIVIDKNRPPLMIPENKACLLNTLGNALFNDVISYKDCIAILDIIAEAYIRRKEELEKENE